MSDTGSVVGVLGAGATFLLLGRWCLQHFGTHGIERRLEGLYGQVVAWQAAHDHQVEAIDRRLRAVEKSAAAAENEARMVSVQIVDLVDAGRNLLGRIDQVERRMARGAAHGRSASVRYLPIAAQASTAGRNVDTGAER